MRPRARIDALVSVFAILWIIGGLLLLDGEAEARRRHRVARNPPNLDQPQDSEAAEVSPEVEVPLQSVQVSDELKAFLQGAPEAAGQNGGHPQAAGQPAESQGTVGQETGTRTEIYPSAAQAVSASSGQSSMSASAERARILRFEDARGGVHYTNTPCEPRFVRLAPRACPSGASAAAAPAPDAHVSSPGPGGQHQPATTR